MRHRLLHLLSACILLALPLPLGAASYLFVFDGASPTVAVYDAQKLQRVASPSVGLRAAYAFGVADPSDPAKLAKFYVVTEGSVAVLRSDFSVRANLFLPEPLAPGSHAAALSPDGRRLLVAAGKSVYIIDTSTDSITAALQPGFAPTDVAVLPGSQRAYVLSNQSRFMRVIDLAANELLDTVAELPVIFTTLASSPDGSKLYAAAPGALFDLQQLTPEFFQPLSALEQTRQARGAQFTLANTAGDAPQSLPKNEAPALVRSQRLAIDRLLLTNSDRYLLRLGPQFLRGRFDPDSPLFELQNPATGEPFGSSDLAAVASSADGAAVFVATRNQPRLIKSDSSCSVQQQAVDLPAAPAAMALVASPVEQSNCTLPTTGNGQVVVEKTAFFLQVQGPTGGVQPSVTATPANVVTCNTPLLSGLTTFSCDAGDVAGTTPVHITINSPVGCASFDITVVPLGATVEGLTKVFGDGASILKNSSFQLIVEARSGGTPQGGVQLNVVATPGSPTVVCPPTVVTGIDGRATITCNAGTVTINTAVQIKVTDAANATRSVTFAITVLVLGNPSSGLNKISADPRTVASGTTFNLSVQAFSGTTPQVGLPLVVSPNKTILDCASPVNTGAQGIADISCTAAAVATNTEVSVLVGDGTRSLVFTVNVVPSGTLVNGITKVSGDNQFVPLLSSFPLPLVVRAVNEGGPQQGLTLTVLTNSNNIFCTQTAFTDEDGVASINCSARAVAAENFVTINVRDATGRTLAEPFRATLLPTPPGVATDVVILSDSPVTGQVGQTLDEGVQVRAVNAIGDPVKGVAVFFFSAQDLTFNPPAGVTNKEGLVSSSVIFGCPPRTGQINIGLQPNEIVRSINYLANRGPLGRLEKIQGDNQSGGAGQELTQQALVIKATDACGTGIGGFAVQWTVNPPEAATLLNTLATTDASGRSSTRVRLGNRSGAFTITAATGGFTATFNLSVVAVASRLESVSGNNQTVALGQATAQPIVVRVLSDNNVGVNGINVSFSVISGTGTVAPQSVLSDNQGNASAVVQAGNSLTPIVVRVTASGIAQSVQFNVNTSGRLPSVTLLGFVNGASFRQGWVPGSTGTIFGVGLMEGVDGVVSSSTFPFPTELSGVSVTVNGFAAPILALANVNGQEQINIQVPFNIPAPGAATVVITNNGSSTTIPGVQILALQPGIFEVSVEGGRFAAALHADYTLVTPSHPAQPGEVILLFLTGLGLTSPPVATNVAGPIPPAQTVAHPVVGIDDVGMQVVSNAAYYAPSLVTVYQVNFVVGPDVQSGNRSLNAAFDGTASPRVLLPVRR